MFNIKEPRLDYVLRQIPMASASAYLPKDYDPSRTPSLPPPDNMNKCKQMYPTPLPPARINYYPMQDNPNTMAVGNANEPKIGNPTNNFMNALKPVGKGATVFDPFNLKSLH